MIRAARRGRRWQAREGSLEVDREAGREGRARTLRPRGAPERITCPQGGKDRLVVLAPAALSYKGTSECSVEAALERNIHWRESQEVHRTVHRVADLASVDRVGPNYLHMGTVA